MADYLQDLQFGIFPTPNAAGAGQLVELAALADVSGLDLFTVQDHPYQARFLDTWTLLSVIAAQTSTIRVAPNDMWRRRTADHIEADPVAWARETTSIPPVPILRADDVPLDLVEDVGRRVVAAVGEKRSTWRRANLYAEAARQTLGWRFANNADREAVTGLFVDAAERGSLRLTPRVGEDAATVPARGRRDRLPTHALDRLLSRAPARRRGPIARTLVDLDGTHQWHRDRRRDRSPARQGKPTKSQSRRKRSRRTCSRSSTRPHRPARSPSTASLPMQRPAGAKVLLVGDWAQLRSVEAGGAFDMLAEARDDAVELVGIHRFTRAWEKGASLDLRHGRREAIDAYLDHQRASDSDSDDMADAVYRASRDDTAAGRASVLIADTSHVVHELNAKARTERLLSETREGAEAGLIEGTRASVDDWIINRKSDRRLRTLRAGWIRNGDRWRVTDVGTDDSMTPWSFVASTASTAVPSSFPPRTSLNTSTSATRSPLTAFRA